MATVKKIVEEHGGSLEFLSEEGQGTEVILTLPEHPTTPAPGADDASTGSHPALKLEDA